MPASKRPTKPTPLSADKLSKCELFGEFTPQARKSILEFSEPRRLVAGQELFSEGEPCGALHLLLEGAVKMNKVSPDGKEQVIRQLKPGQIFGAAPLFTPEATYPVTAVALHASTVLVVPKDPFIRYLKREPDMLLKVLAHVSQHLQQMMRLAETVSLDRVPKRVAAFLLKEAERGGGPRQGQVLDLARSQSEWAAELGTVREVLGRVLQRWKKDALLKVEQRRIVLLDPAALRAEADGGAD